MIRSKAGVTTAELGDQYCMLGPYNEDCVKLEVEVLEPEFSIMKETIEALRKEGVKASYNAGQKGVINDFCVFQVVFGRWLIDGYPYVSSCIC